MLSFTITSLMTIHSTQICFMVSALFCLSVFYEIRLVFHKRKASPDVWTDWAAYKKGTPVHYCCFTQENTTWSKYRNTWRQSTTIPNVYYTRLFAAEGRQRAMKQTVTLHLHDHIVQYDLLGLCNVQSSQVNFLMHWADLFMNLSLAIIWWFYHVGKSLKL